MDDHEAKVNFGVYSAELQCRIVVYFLQGLL